MKPIKKQIKRRVSMDVTRHDFVKSNFVAPVCRPWWHYFLIGKGVFLVLVLIIFGGAVAYAQAYKGKIYPGVYIGAHSFGGATEAEAKEFVENFNNRITKESLDFYFRKNGDNYNFKFSVVPTSDSSVELIKLNSDQTAATLMAAGRADGFWRNLWQPIYYRFFSPRLVAAAVAGQDNFMPSLENYMSAMRDKPRNANIKITNLSPLEYAVVPEKSGFVFDYDRLRQDIQNRLAVMSIAPIEIYTKEFMPEVLAKDLTALIDKLPNVLNYGDLGLNYIDPRTKARRDWNVSSSVYSQWLEAARQKDGLVFILNKEKVAEYLETIRPFIDAAPQNAKFVMENNRVKEFNGSRTGISINAEKTYSDLNTIFQGRNYDPSELNKTVTVSVDIVKPTVEMSDVNNLGIMEVLGVGYSTFRDSHTNRIKNIANAVKRLNGILIKPGEVFSANKFAGPYTPENGFLPEMVIKGNQIIPEVGGGMCQIGTTLFRMAMNAGMPITERRNHSLVVGYYADPVNGNPGTDATLYEPNVDFKFLNDTGGYLLIQTEIDYKNQRLIFTLWGKSDGRSGSYSHPTVKKWIPAGEPQEIITPDLKPGEKKCQNAFRGAVASFIYTRFTSTTEKIERVFDSYYRPLPKICTIGAEPGAASSTPSSLEGLEAVE